MRKVILLAAAAAALAAFAVGAWVASRKPVTDSRGGVARPTGERIVHATSRPGVTPGAGTAPAPSGGTVAIPAPPAGTGGEAGSGASPGASPAAIPGLPVPSGVGDAAEWRPIRVRTEQVLAVVNDVPVAVKDMMPTPPGAAGAEREIPLTVLRSLLERAVDRELVVQAARAKGVGLTEAQKKGLVDLKASLREEENDPTVIWNAQPMTEEMLDFQVRDATGLLLQANLAAQAGVRSEHVTPADVDAYHRAHGAEFGELPADPTARKQAWERIDAEIRVKLAPIVKAEYDRGMKAFMDGLRRSAKIERKEISP